MTTLRDRQQKTVFKAMIIGPPGGGKTGALADVVHRRKELGIERFICEDWDDGLLVLSQLLSGDDLDCFHYMTLRDKLKATPKGVTVTGEPQAYSRGLAMMNNWKEPDGTNFGPCSTWGPETLFLADSLTGMGDAAMRWSRYVQNADIEDSDWQYTALAMSAQDKYVQLLLALQCHVVLTAHIRYMGGGGTKVIKDKHGSEYKTEVHSMSEGTAYPSALGQQLPPQIARHFDIVLEAKLEGTKRYLLTKPELNVPLKAPLPKDFPAKLPAETGLARVMSQILSNKNKEEKE